MAYERRTSSRRLADAAQVLSEESPRAAVKPARTKAMSRARLMDEFPFELSDTRLDRARAEKLVLARQVGLLGWSWHEHGKEPVVLDAQELELLKSFAGEDLDIVQRALQSSRKARAQFGSSRVRHWFGKCDLWVTMLDEHDCDAVVVSPSRNPQGVNGSLVVTRGPSYTPQFLAQFLNKVQEPRDDAASAPVLTTAIPTGLKRKR